MNDFLEIIKNLCIFVGMCSFACLCGVYFFGACWTRERWRFSGTMHHRVAIIFSLTEDFIKWKANRLLHESVFSTAR